MPLPGDRGGEGVEQERHIIGDDLHHCVPHRPFVGGHGRREHVHDRVTLRSVRNPVAACAWPDRPGRWDPAHQILGGHVLVEAWQEVDEIDLELQRICAGGDFLGRGQQVAQRIIGHVEPLLHVGWL